MISNPAPLGEGHTTILQAAYNAIDQGTWAFNVPGTKNWISYLQNTSGANADALSYKVTLAPGVYTIMLLYMASSVAGIAKIKIDGVEVMAEDLYAGSDAAVMARDPGNVVSGPGIHDVQLLIDGKNGSSGGYYSLVSAIVFWRTG